MALKPITHNCEQQQQPTTTERYSVTILLLYVLLFCLFNNNNNNNNNMGILYLPTYSDYSERLSNEDSAYCPSYIEMCTKLPLK